jgi:hypothetical protein
MVGQQIKQQLQGHVQTNQWADKSAKTATAERLPLSSGKNAGVG